MWNVSEKLLVHASAVNDVFITQSGHKTRPHFITQSILPVYQKVYYKSDNYDNEKETNTSEIPLMAHQAVGYFSSTRISWFHENIADLLGF